LTRYGSSSPAASSVVFVAGSVAAGASAGARLRCTGSAQPSCPHGPCCVVRPGALLASVRWPSVQVPRTRTVPRGLLLTIGHGM